MNERNSRTRCTYRVDLGSAEDGVTITFPDLPEAISGAATEAEAFAAAVDCLEEAIAGRLNRNETIPDPSPARGRPTVGPGAVIAAKAALREAMVADGVAVDELARRLSSVNRKVRGLLDPRTKSSIEALESALATLGCRVVVSVEAA